MFLNTKIVTYWTSFFFYIKNLLRWQIDNILDRFGSNQVNLLNSKPGSWDLNNPLKIKIKIDYETQFPTNSILKNEIEKKFN
jgi:hypothetical protein